MFVCLYRNENRLLILNPLNLEPVSVWLTEFFQNDILNINQNILIDSI